MTSSSREEFNWRETGPTDVLRGAYHRLDGFVQKNGIYLAGMAVVLVVATWHFQPTWPGLPNWTKVALAAILPAAPIGAYVGIRLAAALDTPDTELLSVQNPVTGDQELVHVAPDRFESMTVLNHNGQERDRTYLHKVVINGRRAYEVDDYDREENTAIASWQAGVANTAIRKDRAEIKRIKTSLEREADKSLELLANHPHILREQARTVSMRLIRVAEGVEVPEGGELHEELSTLLDESDPSEDLLEGDLDGSSDAPDDASAASSPDGEGDIFARAAAEAEERAKNGGAAAPDGGGS